MGETQNNKMAAFWCNICKEEVSTKVHCRVPHLSEESRDVELSCPLCGAKVMVELIRVKGVIYSSTHGDNR